MAASLTTPVATARNAPQSTLDFLERPTPQVGRPSREVLFSGLDRELHRIRRLEAGTQPLRPNRTQQFLPLLKQKSPVWPFSRFNHRWHSIPSLKP